MAVPAKRPRSPDIPDEKPPRGGKLLPWYRRVLRVSYLGVALYIFVLVGLALILWSTRRERESHVRVPDIADFEQALPSIANLTGSPVIAGNRVEVLQDGEGFFPVLLADIAAARESVHLETYVWWEGEICRQVARALADKARQGVEVRLLLDAVGSKKGDDELFEEIRKAGGKVEKFHPFSLADIGLINNRTHRKVAILDGRVGHVFGHGIAQEWTGRAQDEKHWRDTGVRLEGPVVNAVQAVFAENWVEQSEEVLVGEKYFPALPAAGSVRAHVTASSPQGGVSRLEMLLKLAIVTAQEELLIQNPYFIPDGEMVGLMEKAVERGVDVRVMVPGVVTDSSVVRHAGHRRFEELLDHGVKICEYQRTLNHQKVMVVDGIWSLVGSTNLDDRSLDINDEASVGLIDRGVAGELRAAFAADARHCRPITPETWGRRSAWHKLVDRVSYLLNEQL
ncbi:MAG TPA: phospholipase D-like domain-containing protein [Thermoanaerobaculia bacterium]|nr:phospholipase D-like domain-containing protein [Thermoanaerobaculia bacterium]